jgi:hypothetical protein
MSAAPTLDVLAPESDADPLSPRPVLRITPAPDVELPFDDERTGPHFPPGQDTLPLRFEPGHAAPALRLVPAVSEIPTPAAPGAAVTALLVRPPAALPRPDVRMLVQALCEVLSGTRSAVQLTASVSPSVLAALRSSADSGPWRSPEGVGPRPAVRSVHVRETSDGVLDVCAVVRRGPRHHALALRMRRRRTRWEATTVQVG